MVLRLSLLFSKKKFLNTSSVLSTKIAGKHIGYPYNIPDPPKGWQPPCDPSNKPPRNQIFPYKIFTVRDIPELKGSWHKDSDSDKWTYKSWLDVIFFTSLVLFPVAYIVIYRPPWSDIIHVKPETPHNERN